MNDRWEKLMGNTFSLHQVKNLFVSSPQKGKEGDEFSAESNFVQSPGRIGGDDGMFVLPAPLKLTGVQGMCHSPVARSNVQPIHLGIVIGSTLQTFHTQEHHLLLQLRTYGIQHSA